MVKRKSQLPVHLKTEGLGPGQQVLVCVICEATILLAWWYFGYQLLTVNAHRIR
jgi:hypothetical protein